jgi:hypothetical protein
MFSPKQLMDLFTEGLKPERSIGASKLLSCRLGKQDHVCIYIYIHLYILGIIPIYHWVPICYQYYPWEKALYIKNVITWNHIVYGFPQ